MDFASPAKRSAACLPVRSAGNPSQFPSVAWPRSAFELSPSACALRINEALRFRRLHPVRKSDRLPVAFGNLWTGNRPLDPNVRIIEPNRHVRLRVINRRRFVLHFRPVGKHAKPSRKTRRRPHHFFIRRRKLPAPPLPERRRALAEIHRHQKRFPHGHAHQLAHRRVVLKVQPAQNILLRSRMVVLHKLRRQAQRLELVLAVRLHEKSAIISERLWRQNHNLAKVRGFHLELSHVRTLTSSQKLRTAPSKAARAAPCAQLFRGSPRMAQPPRSTAPARPLLPPPAAKRILRIGP